MLTKDLAICIRAIDYSETSQIVSFFTRATGKIDAIAKGSKRPKSPFDGPIEVLSHGNIVFVDSGGEKLATLTEFQQQPALINLRNNLFVLYACLFAAELMNNLTHDYDPHPELFDGFLEFLQNVNEQHSTSDQQRDILALLILFQLTLLREIGIQPILNHCVNCKTIHESQAESHELYFSNSANGLICRDCESSFPDKIRLTKAASACLVAFKQIPCSAENTLKEIEKVLVQHLTGLLGRTPKMAKHILGN
ncbi:MAG TPA: DNA repair protein RecO [Sedimentisphaerales bacterium]|nr:DNA repair protein RecO [Sedimentisphaerales bacterium]